MLHLRDVRGIGVGGKRVAVLPERLLPLARPPASACRSSRTISPRWSSTVGIVADALDGLAHVLLRQRVLALLEVGPAQRIEVRVVLRIEATAFCSIATASSQLHAALGKHVAEVVLDSGVLRIDRQGLAELGLGLVVQLLALRDAAAREDE